MYKRTNPQFFIGSKLAQLRSSGEIARMKDEIEQEFNYNKKDEVVVARLLINIYYYTDPQLVSGSSWFGSSYDINDKNHLNLDKKQLRLVNYKNRKFEDDDKIVDIPDELIKIMKESKTLLKSKWILPRYDDKTRHMADWTFTRTLYRLFRKREPKKKEEEKKVDVNREMIQKKINDLSEVLKEMESIKKLLDEQ